MVKEVVTVSSGDVVTLTLSENLHRDICRLQAAIIQENKRAIGDHIENAAERSYELMFRLRESSVGE
jgi:hypothetical protein